MKFQPPARVVERTELVQLDPENNGSDAWKTMDLLDILSEDRGGLGVLPTDTGYCFVTPVNSKKGLDRLIRLKCRNNPIGILCSDLSTIDKYCYGIDKDVFKMCKKYFPGPHTFVLPAKPSTTPKAIFKGSQKETLGVRMPNDPVLRYLQDELLGGMPLLVSSVSAEDRNEDDGAYDDDDDEDDECGLDLVDEPWYNEVDFVVDAGPRPCDGSSVFDMTKRGQPTLVREGLGELELAI